MRKAARAPVSPGVANTFHKSSLKKRDTKTQIAAMDRHSGQSADINLPKPYRSKSLQHTFLPWSRTCENTHFLWLMDGIFGATSWLANHRFLQKSRSEHLLVDAGEIVCYLQ